MRCAWAGSQGIVAFALAIGLLLSACAPTGVVPPPLPGPRTERVYVVARGWHTEIVLPQAALGPLLAGLQPAASGAPYLSFGWGARDYYMSPDPGLADALRASMPGPAVMLVIPLFVSPGDFAAAGGEAIALDITREGMARLRQFLWRSFAKDEAAKPRPVGVGLYPQSLFYAATGTYDLGHTCNTWTAAAVAAAGLPLDPAGIVFAGQLVDRLRPLAARASR
jgi:uncharacterized protein (TIGR02117 family)